MIYCYGRTRSRIPRLNCNVIDIQAAVRFQPGIRRSLMRKDCDYIVNYAISQVLPEEAVKRALRGHRFAAGPAEGAITDSVDGSAPVSGSGSSSSPAGRLLLVAVGKAAWSMAAAAHEVLGSRISEGIVITKHGYSQGPIGSLKIREAGHPVPDADSFSSTKEALEMTCALTPDDEVLFLLSGGGSTLFESPACSEEDLQAVTNQLLAKGADIVSMNKIRKRLSRVKGGRFAQHCAPARVFTVVLSDIIGDPLDMIASGPAYPDSSTCEDAKEVVRRFGIELPPACIPLMELETPKQLDNVETVITGSVRELCAAAAHAAEELGYEPHYLTDCLECEASEAGSFLSSIARSWQDSDHSVAFIAGGETVVHLNPEGHGTGGRNQVIAFSAAEKIAGLPGTAIFSAGSDGSDGPNDAAGGYVDGETAGKLAAAGLNAFDILNDNDTYHGLEAVGGLIKTGATGTNVNDVSVVLIRR